MFEEKVCVRESVWGCVCGGLMVIRGKVLCRGVVCGGRMWGDCMWGGGGGVLFGFCMSGDLFACVKNILLFVCLHFGFV